MKTIIKYLILLLCLFGSHYIFAQQIIKAEYFIDTDPGVGNGINIPITPGDDLDVSFSAGFPGLESGFHMLSVRVMDENEVWTHNGTRNIYIESEINTGQIIAAEYFIDDDPGVGKWNKHSHYTGR